MLKKIGQREVEAILTRVKFPLKPPDIVINLPGTPRGKKSPKARAIQTASGRVFATTYQDSQTRSYEGMLRFAGEEARNRAGFSAPFDCPLRVRVTGIFMVPQSWSTKKTEQALAGQIAPTTKPDWENIAKTLDGLTSVIWRDDALIVAGEIYKFFGVNPCLHVEVWRWTSGEANSLSSAMVTPLFSGAPR